MLLLYIWSVCNVLCSALTSWHQSHQSYRVDISQILLCKSEISMYQHRCKWLHIFNCFYLKMIFFVTRMRFVFWKSLKKISPGTGKCKLSADHHKMVNKLCVDVINHAHTHIKLCRNGANLRRRKKKQD